MFNRANGRQAMQRAQAMQQRVRSRGRGKAAHGSLLNSNAVTSANGSTHPFTSVDENKCLFQYEQKVKQSFERIENVLQRLSSMQHEMNFEERAQALSKTDLGFELPAVLLADCWIKPLDISKLYAWCVFETFRRMSDDFFTNKPLANDNEEEFQRFLESCGFHTLDVSPCADGRLAHVIRYVLRLPYKIVRRKSYAGAMFDVDDSLQKWVETEMLRHREARPNAADAPTRYLKTAVYHHSASLPDCEGCAAHGSNTQLAAEAALERLKDFKQGVENSFCCGASIDLLLIGIDTDSDTIRLHLPNVDGHIAVDHYIDAAELYKATRGANGRDAKAVVITYMQDMCTARNVSTPAEGMLTLAARLLCGNLSQIDYVRQFHGGCYSDIGHQESFIGMGIGFEEIQLRNLTYFAYLQTVEEGAKDMDVGIKIFTGLNASRGLPVPVVIRNDYHGQVPGARERAVARCNQLNKALHERFSDFSKRGLLHTLLMVRDCQKDARAETVGSSLELDKKEAH